MASICGKLIIVTGGSTSSGKTTLVNYLLNEFPKFSRIITYTTRPPREGEIQEKDYYFLTRFKFQEQIQSGQILEWFEYADNLYGTGKQEIEKVLNGKNKIWVIHPVTAADIRNVLKHWLNNEDIEKILKNTLIIYLDVEDEEVIKERLKERGYTEEIIKERTNQTKKDRLAVIDKFEHIIINKEGKLGDTLLEG